MTRSQKTTGSKPPMRGIEAGMMLVGTLVAGLAAGAALGALLDAMAPLLIAGLFIGLFGGVALVVARFRDL